MELLSSPSYHHISPLARSRSDVRSVAMKRSNSFSGTPVARYSSQNRISAPSYGYGGGYMSRSLSKCGSTLFGRSLAASALTTTAPLHNVGVQRSTPHYMDKYPYVRYSYGNSDTGAALLTQSDSIYPSKGGIRDMGTKRWLEGRLNTYNTGLFTKPDRRSQSARPPVTSTASKSYIRYMPLDDAVDMYKKRCMTVGTLSKYWLSPATWASRREKELNLSSSLSRGNYSYSNRFDRFSSRLY